MSGAARPLPRLPVFGWQAFEGAADADTPCLLDLPQAVYTTSGRAALLLALETLQVGPGDRVLLPTYHCPTMVAPAAERGARPVFYPIDVNGGPMIEWLDRQDLSGVKAMVAAHFFGIPQPMCDLRRWCDARGISLIEDCAHTLFGRSGERAVGQWGDMAIGSLTKFLPVSEGGCLISNNGARTPGLAAPPLTHELKAGIDIIEEGAAHARMPGLNWAVRATLGSLRGVRSALRGRALGAAVVDAAADDDPTEGFTIDAAVAHRALSRPCQWVARRLPRQRIVERRRQNYAALAERLAGRQGLHPLRPTLPPECAPYVFPLWVDHPDPGYAEMRRRRKPVFRWDRLWPAVPVIAGDHGLEWSHHVLQLACHQDLPMDTLDRYVVTLLALFEQR